MELKAENISKRYFRKSGGANYFYAVNPMSITLKPGTLTVLCGRSGSGKTTLLHMLSGLLTPTEGKVYFGETDLYTLSDRELSSLRNRSIGVIPQARSVLDTLTVLENILLPGQLYDSRDRKGDALHWMEELNIAHLAEARATELSGGELRRAAIARTFYLDPEVILADEPTGDLDDSNTRTVLQLLRQAANRGKAVLLVTHEENARAYADRSFRMEQGSLTEE